MQKLQLKFQKFVVFLALVVSAASFVYTLGFETNLYALHYHSNPTSASLYVEGSELYSETQPYNHEMLAYTLLLFIINITIFIYIGHKRRRYYLSNYITTLVYSGFACYIGWFIRSNNVVIKEKYLSIDFDKIYEACDTFGLSFTKSTFFLDLGMIVGYMLFGIAALLVLNLLWKTIMMITESSKKKSNSLTGVANQYAYATAGGSAALTVSDSAAEDDIDLTQELTRDDEFIK